MVAMGLKKAKPQPGEWHVRALEEVSPEYVSLLAKRDALNVELRQLREETEALVERIRTEEPVDRAQSRILRIVGDEVSDVSPISRERLAEIEQRMADLEAAVRLLDQRVSTARYRASAIICDENQEAHRELVRGICLKLIEAFEACQTYTRLIDTFEREDISWVMLRPMVPTRIFGNTGRDNQSPAAFYLREAVEFGFLERSEIPEALR